MNEKYFEEIKNNLKLLKYKDSNITKLNNLTELLK
jgi:hypothetical protein